MQLLRTQCLTSASAKCRSSLVLLGGPDCFRDTLKDARVENPTLVLRSSALPNLTLVKPAPEARAEMYNIGVRAGVMIAPLLSEEVFSSQGSILWTRSELTWLTLMTFAPPLASKRALASAFGPFDWSKPECRLQTFWFCFYHIRCILIMHLMWNEND